MSINDPIEIVYDDKREKYYCKRGNETFYDEKRIWIQFDTVGEAMEFAAQHSPEGMQLIMPLERGRSDA